MMAMLLHDDRVGVIKMVVGTIEVEVVGIVGVVGDKWSYLGLIGIIGICIAK
jgi:hypothetical protein